MKKIKYKKFNTKGFTLIELLVTVAIMSFMMGGFFVNYKETNRRNELVLAAQNLISSARLAQNNTMGSVEYNGSVPDGGWGLHFDLSATTKEYYIFADLNQNMTMDMGEYISSYGAQRITLPDDVSLASTTVGNTLDITFLPPMPFTNIWDGSSTTTMASIQLNDAQGSSKVIAINLFGLIEVTR